MCLCLWRSEEEKNTHTRPSQSLRYRHQKATGLTGGLDHVHYVLLTVKGTMLFLLMILAGTGWSVLKPALGELEKKIACAILPLQVAVNVALGVLQETSEGDAAWEKWRLVLQFFDLLCCCAVAMTIASSMRRVGSDTQREESLAIFKRFYVSLFLFVFVARVVLAILESSLSFRYTWVAPCVQVCKKKRRIKKHSLFVARTHPLTASTGDRCFCLLRLHCLPFPSGRTSTLLLPTRRCCRGGNGRTHGCALDGESFGGQGMWQK